MFYGIDQIAQDQYIHHQWGLRVTQHRTVAVGKSWQWRRLGLVIKEKDERERERMDFNVRPK